MERKIANMADKQNTEQHPEALRTVYEEVCKSYERIDDFRAKLLGFLPFASGTGIFLLLADKSSSGPRYLAFAGILGFVITIGLFFYELRGIQRCIRLSRVGKELEYSMGVEGQFQRWPHSLGRFINEPIAASIIYPIILAAWSYVATFSIGPQIATWISAVVFIIGFVSGWRFYIYAREDKNNKNAKTQ